MPSLSTYEPIVAGLKAAKSAVDKRLEVEQKEKARLEKQLDLLQQAQLIAQEVAQVVQQRAHHRLASVVTRCLRAVFGDDAYEFRIDFERKRGKTEARMFFIRDGLEVDPLTAAGGGPVDVAAFALRLAALVLSRPIKRRILFLDEALRFLSREYWPAARGMIEAVAEEMGVQILLVTHQEGLVAGKIVRL